MVPGEAERSGSLPGKFTLLLPEALLWSFCNDGKVTLVKIENSLRRGTCQGCIVRLLKCERNRLHLETAAFSTYLSERDCCLVNLEPLWLKVISLCSKFVYLYI